MTPANARFRMVFCGSAKRRARIAAPAGSLVHWLSDMVEAKTPAFDEALREEAMRKNPALAAYLKAGKKKR